MKNSWILTVTILVMLAYTGWRVYDYMSTNLVGVDQGTGFWVALAFLTFTEIGLLVWLHVAQPGATTNRQENVANVMVWVDYAGSMLLGLADLVKHNTMYRVDLSKIDPVLFIAPWVIVAANVAAWIVFKTNDSDEKLRREERRLLHAEHELEIKARTDAIAALRANTEGLARKLAPYYYRDIADRVTGRTAIKFGREAERLPDVEIVEQPPAPTRLDKVKALFGRNHHDLQELAAEVQPPEDANPTLPG